MRLQPSLKIKAFVKAIKELILMYNLSQGLTKEEIKEIKKALNEDNIDLSFFNYFMQKKDNKPE